MSGQLLSSKIVVQEEPPSLRTLQNVASGVLAATGLTAKGPVGFSTLVTSFEAFVRIFGGDIAAGFATSAVRGFFAGGGQRLYFTRVVHYADITDPTSKVSAAGTLSLRTPTVPASGGRTVGTTSSPFSLTPGDTLTVARDALGNATATLTATAAALQSARVVPPYALADGQTLLVKINGEPAQTVTFHTAGFAAIGAATLLEVISRLSAALVGATVAAAPAGVGGEALLITSNRRGSSSSVEITGGTATALGFATSVEQGTGNVADIELVTALELKTVIEAAVSGVVVAANDAGHLMISSLTIGPTSSVQVIASSTADDELGFDNLVRVGSTGAAQDTLRIDAKYDGIYASNVTVLISAATSKAPGEFNLSVLRGGVVVESFPNVTMLTGASRHVATIVNADNGTGSELITVTDLVAATGAIAKRPAISPGSPAVAWGPLTGGDDGLVGLTDIDFVGDASSRLGFHAFDLNADIDLLISPDRATPAVHDAGLSYASITRNHEVFFIVDPPAGLSPAGILAYVDTTAGLVNLTESGAVYWPRVKVLNPNVAIYGSVDTIIVPPSGHIAGMIARTDSQRVGGIYDPPGGVERGLLPGVLGFENDEVLDEAVRDLLAPKLINPITKLRGQPIAVDDVLTLKAGGAFPTIAERRGVSFIERVLKDGLQFARLRNNDESLRDEVERTIEAFLLLQMRSGAFRSMDPTKAFFVDVSEAINPPTEVFAGKLNVRVGLATQKPARFLVLSFAQDTRAIDEELAGAAG